MPDPRFSRILVAAVLTIVAAASALRAQSRPAERPDTLPPSRPSVAAKVEEAKSWLSRPSKETRLGGFHPAADIRLRVYDAPHPQRIWIVRIDTTAKDVEFVVTEPDPSTDETGRKFETRSETTLAFARRVGVQLAVNTSAFGPGRAAGGEPMDVAGLAAASGTIYSEPVKDYGAMYISRKGRIALKGPPLDTNDAWNVVAGFRMLLDDGKVVVRQDVLDSSFGGVNPRTAVGTDRDGKTLWIVIADGRQSADAVGLTLAELTAVFELLNAWDALNLDGGGSSTLVAQDADGVHRVLNSPIDGGKPGNLRQVANNLGIFLPGKGPAAGDIPVIEPKAKEPAA